MMYSRLPAAYFHEKMSAVVSQQELEGCPGLLVIEGIASCYSLVPSQHHPIGEATRLCAGRGEGVGELPSDLTMYSDLGTRRWQTCSVVLGQR